MKNPILWLTREIRSRKVLDFIKPKEIHVDIGCGTEKYLLKKSPCRTKIGFDKQLGHCLQNKIPVKSKGADYVTMLAVIEHLNSPSQMVKECHRILKDDGVLIITTPKSRSLWFSRLYAPGFEEIEGEHKHHFDYQKMYRMLNGYFSISTYKTFEFGFNQLFVCNKII